MNEELKKLNSEYIKVEENASLKRYNSFKLDVRANTIINVKNVVALKTVLQTLKNHNAEYMVVGKGSNLLFTERATKMNFIVLAGEFSKHIIEDDIIVAGPAVGIVPMSVIAAKNGLSGLEFANGIPGSIGGAVTMNAGAHGSEFSEIIESIRYLDEDLIEKELKNEDLNFSYRTSELQNHKWIITQVRLKMEYGASEEIMFKTKESKDYRLSTQPLKKRTCGSVFRNPLPLHAAKIIEDMGLKSFQFNTAKVSNKHANFIEVDLGARSEDILHIIGLIQESAKREFDVNLKLEVKIV